MLPITIKRSTRASNAVVSGPPTSPSKRASSSSLPTSIKKSKSSLEIDTTAIEESVSTGSSKSVKKVIKKSAAVVVPVVLTVEEQAILLEETKNSEMKAEEEKVLLHPAITFNFADARSHLIAVDQRWKSLVDSMICSTFQGKDTAFNPFRSLVTSIIGQQISYLAARAVTYRFTRLFYPHLPEKMAPSTSAPTTAAPSTLETSSPFPTPSQVLALANPTEALRSAGLSGRKTEYVIELANQFHDGRLDAAKLWNMDDEAIIKLLIGVRGIGRWTIDMLLIFSMRRADILPYGDLGIQKNICKWYASHPESNPVAAPPPSGSSTPSTSKISTPVPSTPPMKSKTWKVIPYPTPSSPSTKLEDSDNEDEVSIPVAVPALNHFVFPPTSNNLTSELLKARLNKKLKGNIYLTPLEMDELSAPWRPYMSVACFYLWGWVDGDGCP